MVADMSDDGYFRSGTGAEQIGKFGIVQNRQNLRCKRFLVGRAKVVNSTRQETLRG